MTVAWDERQSIGAKDAAILGEAGTALGHIIDEARRDDVAELATKAQEAIDALWALFDYKDGERFIPDAVDPNS